MFLPDILSSLLKGKRLRLEMDTDVEVVEAAFSSTGIRFSLERNIENPRADGLRSIEKKFFFISASLLG